MAVNCFTDKEQLELFGDADLSILDKGQLLAKIDKKALDLSIQKRQKKLQAVAIHDVKKYIDSAKDKKEAFKSFFSYRGGKDIGMPSVERHQEAVLGEFHSQLAEMMESYKATKLGFAYDKEGVRNMVRELFGQTTGDDQASAFSKIWREVTDKARDRFNKAGGAIAKLDEWNLPQSHHDRKIANAGKEAWKADIKELINRDKMLDDTGRKISEEDLNKALDKMYERVTNEFYDLEAGKTPKNVTAKMANRHREHRFLHFKDGDAWLQYHDKYGADDNPFITMTKHLDGMAMEIGLLERMGPNPDATFKYMSDSVKKATGKEGSVTGAEKIYKNIAGKLAPTDQNIADAMSSLRSAEVATKLGSATLSAISDPSFAAITAAFNGLPVTKIMAKMMSNLVLNDATTRTAATRMGLVADYAIHSAMTASRYTEVTGHGAMAKLADATMRASGLKYWTETHRMTFKMEFLGAMSDFAKNPYSKLNSRFKNALKRYGITESDWSKISKSERMDVKGSKFINPMAIDDVKLRDKVLGMIAEETDMAVPSPNARTRAFLNQGLKAGDLSGELLRTVGMFKTFPVSIVMGHLSRGFSQSSVGGRLAYLGGTFVATTVLGTLAYQAKEISKGREPIEWDPTTEKGAKLWVAGMAQGGGLGIFGDFLFSDVNRFGSSLGATLAGPIVSDAEKIVLKYIIGSGRNIIEDQQKGIERFKATTGKLAEQFTPMQLWYTKLIMQRYLFNSLNKQLDPKWEHKQRLLINKRRKEFGNDYWWKP